MSKIYVNQSSNLWKDMCLDYVRDSSGNWIPSHATGRVVWARNSSGAWNPCTCQAPLGWRALATHCETTARVAATYTASGNPYSIDYAPTSNKVFVSEYTDGNIAIVNPATNTVVSTISVVAKTRTVVYDANNDQIYVECENGTVYKINPQTYALSAAIYTPPSLYSTFMNYSAVNNHLYIHNPQNSQILEINESGTLVRTITGVNGATYSEMDAYGNLWAITGNGYNQTLVTLYFIPSGASTPSVTNHIGTISGDTARKIAHDTVRNRMYIPIQNQNTIYVYSTVTGPSAPVNTLVYSHAMGDARYIPQLDRVVVGARTGNTITIINPTDYSTQYQFTAAGGPISVCYCSFNHSYYVANYDSNTVSIIDATNPTMNTGNLVTDTQEQYDTGTLLSTGITVSNTPALTTSPSYIPTVTNTTSCPVG